MTKAVATLNGVRAKLRRAEEHQRNLETEFDSWAKKQSDVLGFNIRRDGPWYVIAVKPMPQPDIRFCCIAGDIVHNLRSALDHLVWQLVLRDGQEPSDRNQFPIYTSKEKFLNEVKFRKSSPERSVLYGITIDGDAWTIIEKAQPYISVKPTANNIALIGRISNLDKHRTLCVHIPIVMNTRDAFGWSADAVLLETRMGATALSFEKPTEIVRFRFADQPHPNVHVKGGLAVSPTFGEGPIKGGYQLSIGTFSELTSSVTAVVDEVSKLPRVIDGKS